VGIITLFAVFLVIAWLTHQPWWQQIDLAMLKSLQPIRNSAGIAFFSWMSFIGTSKVLIPVILIIMVMLAVKKHYFLAVILVIDYAGERLLNIFLKGLFHRQRPPFHHLVYAGGFSFPSGHAMNSLSVYGFIAFILFYVIKNKLLKRFSLFFFIAVIILITFSRPYLEVHYFSDVAAGWCAAGAWLLFLIWLTKRNVFFVTKKEI
jgi:undecaprenyl-diphosphatase